MNRSHSPRFWLVIAAFWIAAALAACAPIEATMPPSATPRPTSTPTATANLPPTPTPDVEPDIVDVIWQWERLHGDEEIVVPEPARYTIELLADGTYRAVADCNRSSGTYTLQGSRLALEPGPTTLAECEPGSLYDLYLARLGTVTAAAVENERLVLALTGGGTMVFARGSEIVQAGGQFDEQTLRELTYRSEWTAANLAPLVDGRYSEPAAPGSATQIVVTLHEHTAWGTTTSGQRMAAAILVTDPGGSGTFYELALVMAQEGRPTHIASAPLGDRVRIGSLVIEQNEIVVEMVAHGPGDPMCCPTQRVVQRYAVRGEELMQISSEVSGGSEMPGILGMPWAWQRFESGDGSTIEVPDPSRYTLTLGADGTYRVQADCNAAAGAYTLTEESLVLEPGPTTLAECEPGSLYDLFLARLADVRTYVLDGDLLVLNLWADAGSVILSRAE